MWSLCWEIGSTVPIKKSVANLSRLSSLLMCSFQNYHLLTSNFRQISQYSSKYLDNLPHKLYYFSLGALMQPEQNVNSFHLISRSPLCHIKSQIVSSFTCLLTQSAQNNRPQCLQWWRRFVTEKEAWNRSRNMIHDAMIWNKLHDLVQLCFW